MVVMMSKVSMMVMVVMTKVTMPMPMAKVVSMGFSISFHNARGVDVSEKLKRRLGFIHSCFSDKTTINIFRIWLIIADDLGSIL